MPSEYMRWSSKIKPKETKNQSECWIWTGATYRSGYGHFRRKINNAWTMEKAHRFSYEYYNQVSRDTLKGLLVCHKCDNPACVNPEHLYLGTTQDNTNDRVTRLRHSFGRNPKHQHLSKEIAEQVRKFHKENTSLTLKEIGSLYHTSATQICRIINNQIWK